MATNKQVVAAMQDQADAITRPYVTVNMFTIPNSLVFYLRIANTGRTGATNVRLSLDHDFFQYGQKNRLNLKEATIFKHPIDQLPPGAEIIFGLAQGFVVFGEKADPTITPPVFSINATYSYSNKAVTEKTTVDLRPYKESMDPPSAIADELKLIREQLEKIAKKN